MSVGITWPNHLRTAVVELCNVYLGFAGCDHRAVSLNEASPLTQVVLDVDNKWKYQCKVKNTIDEVLPTYDVVGVK